MGLEVQACRRSAYLIQSRSASQARPKMPALPTGSSTTSGTSATGAAADRRDLDRADALALGERRDQRVGALDLGLQLAALALRHADEQPAGGAELGLVRLPFQTCGVTIGLPSSNRRIVSNAWKPQFSSFWLSLGARFHRRRVQHDRQEPALAGAVPLGPRFGNSRCAVASRQ